MISTITFDALLDEINTSYDHPQMNRSKYETWLFENFGECVGVNVVRLANHHKSRKIKLVESFVKAHPNAKSYLSASIQNVLLDFCLDCGDIQGGFDKKQFEEMLGDLKSKLNLDGVNGAVYFQILIDSKGKGCVLSHTDESNLLSLCCSL